MQIYKFSNLYNFTSNEQNVLPIYDHNTPPPPSQIYICLINQSINFISDTTGMVKHAYII